MGYGRLLRAFLGTSKILSNGQDRPIVCIVGCTSYASPAIARVPYSGLSRTLIIPLRLRAHVRLPPGRRGAFDHGDVDSLTGRVFVAHTDFGTVDVIDPDSLEAVRSRVAPKEAAYSAPPLPGWSSPPLAAPARSCSSILTSCRRSEKSQSVQAERVGLGCDSGTAPGCRCRSRGPGRSSRGPLVAGSDRPDAAARAPSLVRFRRAVRPLPGKHSRSGLIDQPGTLR